MKEKLRRNRKRNRKEKVKVKEKQKKVLSLASFSAWRRASSFSLTALSLAATLDA